MLNQQELNNILDFHMQYFLRDLATCGFNPKAKKLFRTANIDYKGLKAQADATLKSNGLEIDISALSTEGLVVSIIDKKTGNTIARKGYGKKELGLHGYVAYLLYKLLGYMVYNKDTHIYMSVSNKTVVDELDGEYEVVKYPIRLTGKGWVLCLEDGNRPITNDGVEQPRIKCPGMASVLYAMVKVYDIRNCTLYLYKGYHKVNYYIAGFSLVDYEKSHVASALKENVTNSGLNSADTSNSKGIDIRGTLNSTGINEGKNSKNTKSKKGKPMFTLKEKVMYGTACGVSVVGLLAPTAIAAPFVLVGGLVVVGLGVSSLYNSMKKGKENKKSKDTDSLNNVSNSLDNTSSTGDNSNNEGSSENNN